MARYKKYTLPVGKEDQLRLEALNSICNPKTLEFINSAKLDVIGKTVLDIGCGIGLMAIHWAKLVGESGHVLAVDISEEQLAIAKANAELAGVNNITFVNLEVYRLDELNKLVDIVYNRFLLEHLHDPLLALGKMIGLLKPNGFIFCENVTSYEAIYSDPETDITKKWREIILFQPKLFDTDFYIGKKLYSYYKHFNVQPESYQLQQPLMFPGENRKAFFSGLNNDDIQAKYEEKGFFTKNEIQLVAEGMAKQAMEEGIVSFPQYIQILGRKTD